MPLRIPTIDNASVASRGVDTTAPFMVQPNQQVAQALGNVGQAVGGAVDEYQRRAAQQKAKADALMEANAHTELQRFITEEFEGTTDENGERKPGYLSTQGLTASEQSSKALEQIGKRRREIAADLANDEQRTAFIQQSGQTFESARRTVEGHASQQFKVAQKASLEGLMKETLKDIANSSDDLATPILSARVERLAKTLQLSPEDGAADVSKWRSMVAGAQIDRQLGHGDIAGAEKLLEEKGDDLGVLRDEMSYKIERKKQVGRVQREQTENELTVTGIMGKARNPDRTIDKAKALEMLEEVPPERFTEVRRLFESRMHLYDQVKREETKDRRLLARKQFIDGRGLAGLDPEVKRDLIEQDGEFYTRLKHDEDVANRRARAGVGGAKEQKKADRIATLRFKAALVDDPTLDANEFAAGKGVSDEGMANLELLQKKAGAGSEKKFAAGQRRFVADVERLVPELRAKGKKKPVYGAEEREALRGRALEAYEDFVASHNGKEPNAEETSKITLDLTQEEVVEPGYFGTSIGEKKKPAFLAPKKDEPADPDELIRVKVKATGKTGSIKRSKFNADKYEMVTK